VSFFCLGVKIMSEKVDIKDLDTIKTVSQVVLVVIAFVLFLYFSDGIIDCFGKSRCSGSDKKETITFFVSLLFLTGGFVFIQKSKK
jgi:hypothetical protein